jgi:hypothetical protein
MIPSALGIHPTPADAASLKDHDMELKNIDKLP